MEARQPKFQKVDYDRELSMAIHFLENYEDDRMTRHEKYGFKKYLIQLQEIINGNKEILEIHTQDLQAHFGSLNHDKILDQIKTNTMRYIEMFSEAADNLDIQKEVPVNDDQTRAEEALETFRLNALQNNEALNTDKGKKLLNLIKRKFQVVIISDPREGKNQATALRDIKSDQIGHLVNTRAMVVRVSEVKPIIKIACYLCEVCGFEIYQKVNSSDYAPICDCPSNVCKNNQSRGRIIPNFAVSKFEPFQEVKIQETTDQTPMGSIPRTYNVVVRGALVRSCVPGDIINLTGVYLPQQGNNNKGMKDSLVHDTYIEAFRIVQEKKTFENVEMNQSSIKNIESYAADPKIYEKLAKSICPEIYGMEDVKKALLLLMVGGSTVTMSDGMKIRGDLNVALIGDPGVAKSQLLKHIAHITPRGIYTTGKGSSGAGLTAAVMRDQFTIVLEGGALVLADMGVCCIDEFDKMEDRDRTSIHEVMEQQTVSIAKAGITTQLNARTSILAAANPVWGRYNKLKSPHENINLAPSLLSRFDLIFILLDRPNQLRDSMMAKHITYVHQNRTYPKSEVDDVFDTGFLREYVSYAKRFNPKIPQSLHTYLVKKYNEKRQNNSEGQAQTTYSYTTPRTLLAVIRLSQAMAKLRFSDTVSQEDIEEALNLMSESQRSIMDTTDDVGPKRNKKDNQVQIFEIIKNACNVAGGQVTLEELQKKVLVKGFNSSELEKCIENYEDLDVLIHDKEDGLITMVN